MSDQYPLPPDGFELIKSGFIRDGDICLILPAGKWEPACAEDGDIGENIDEYFGVARPISSDNSASFIVSGATAKPRKEWQPDTVRDDIDVMDVTRGLIG